MPEQVPEQRSDVVRFRRARPALIALGAGCAVALGLFAAYGRPDRRGPSAEYHAYRPASDGELPERWLLPGFSFTDQRRALVSRDSLRGRPFIADFIFTQCTTACPLLTSRMVQLQRRLAGRDLRFISFSVDPAHDDVATLASYAERWNPAESRWSLLATDPKRLVEIVAGFRATADDTQNPIEHSTAFFLVDADSRVRGVYASEDPAALDRLVRDTSSLVVDHARDRDAGPEPRPTYASLGCGGCHDNPRVAPPLVNLSGAGRTLETGRQISIDRAYLRRAILEPGGDVVKGYPSIMPSYRHELKDAEVDALVEELLLRKADTPSASRDVEVGVDPVCHMHVRADPSAPSASYGGHTIYFCSEACRDAFVAAPTRYPLAELPGGPHERSTR